MPNDTLSKMLCVRLTEADHRRYKILAISRGLTLQEVVKQALQAWAAQAGAKGKK